MATWETARLEDLCDLLTCGVAATPKYVDEDIGVPFLSAQNVKNGKVTLHKFRYISQEHHAHLTKKNIPQKGDILYSRVGAGFGDAAVVEHDFDFSVYVSLTLIKPKPDKLYSYYLKYYLNSPKIKSLAISSITSSGVPNLNVKSVRNFPISFPALSEQKRIVALLDTVFADLEQTRAKTEQNLKNARELFDSYLQQVFTQNGEDWVKKTIAELSTKLGDGLHGTPVYSEDGEYYFINGNNLNDGVIEFKERTKKVSIIEFEKYKKNLNNRTILVSINGTLGNVAFYNDEKIILGKSACYFNLNEGVNKEYVKFVIESNIFQNYAEHVATGATIKNVSLKSMRAFPVPLAPEHLQSEVVNNLNKIKLSYIELNRIYTSKLNAIDELKKSILQKAFSGELTKKV